jgi:NAD+ synthase (glutamine-hydrolysing)
MQGTVIASCALTQMSMDFKGNLERILESIIIAKEVYNAKVRVGPELETTGYSCEDHFFELDTIEHSWQLVHEVIMMTKEPPYNDMLISIGAPVLNRGVCYNCMILLYNGKVLMIKAKGDMANDGAYRESRFFACWHRGT